MVGVVAYFLRAPYTTRSSLISHPKRDSEEICSRNLTSICFGSRNLTNISTLKKVILLIEEITVKYVLVLL